MNANKANKLHFYILSSLFAALTAAGAFIKIPLPYVPITLQTFFVLLAGLVLGPKFGALSQIIYLAVGLLGVPIFAHGGGPGYILQPTFGYLLGYPIAAFVIGLLTKRKKISAKLNSRTFMQFCLSSFVGTII
ncbi:MAG: biotin transporter BioY, partial [bacterium]